MISCDLSRSVMGPAPAQPVLTIAIPTYNRLAELSVLVDMIIPQMQGDLLDKVEVIFNDNGSTYGTEDYLCKLAADYPWVSYYRHAENQGIPRQVFFGPARARCQYVWNVGDDDGLKPDAIATVVRILETENVQFVSINREIRDRNMERVISPLMNTAPNRRYDRFQDLLGDFGIYQHGLWVGAVFARDAMNALDYAPYTCATKTANEGYGHIGAYMEAFKDQPAYYLGDAIAIHRDQNFRDLTATYVRHFRMLTVDLMDVLHTAATRAGYPADFCEQVSGVKNVSDYTHASPQKLSDTVIENLLRAIAWNHRFDTDEWTKLKFWSQHWRPEMQACMTLAAEMERKLIKAERAVARAKAECNAIENNKSLRPSQREQKMLPFMLEQRNGLIQIAQLRQQIDGWGKTIYDTGPGPVLAEAYGAKAA